jgi:hypothetical protein
LEVKRGRGKGEGTEPINCVGRGEGVEYIVGI